MPLEHPIVSAAALVVGVALLLLGGHWLVQGSVTIARRLGVSKLVVGLTIVAGGTSAPELFFNVIAVLSGRGDLSFGNIVGSNIANIGLVLGFAALLRPLVVHGRVVNKELPWLVVVSMAMLVLVYLPPGDADGGFAFSGFDGVVMLLWFGVFSVSWFRMGRRDAADPLVRELGAEAEAETIKSVGVAALVVGAGLAALIGGGKLTEMGAVSLAGWLGMSEALIGLTIVAVATSLPELATAVIACMKGHDDLVVGNVVGSNVFNLLLVLGATSAISPISLPRPWGALDLVFMNLITLALLPIAITHLRRITRWEGGMLLVLYGAYMAFSVVREM